MKKINIILIAVLVGLLSCNQDKNKIYSESEKIYKESIKVHDEVMPLMGKIMDLQQILKNKKEEITDEAKIDQINITLQNLENAHNTMMYWMRNLTPIPEEPKDDSDLSNLPSQEEMLKIQERSLEEIKKVKKAILESIDKAETLISSF
jgi:hypothetical protein